MDETAVFFKSKTRTTVNRIDDNLISICCSRINIRRLAAYICVASNCTSLPLFIIFQGEPGGIVEEQLANILPQKVHGCCQPKGWLDDRDLKI